MEQLRIDRKELGLRARARQRRRGEDLAPLQYARPDNGADVDDDLFARIDAVLSADGPDDDDVEA